MLHSYNSSIIVALCYGTLFTIVVCKAFYKECFAGGDVDIANRISDTNGAVTDNNEHITSNRTGNRTDGVGEEGAGAGAGAGAGPERVTLHVKERGKGDSKIDEEDEDIDGLSSIVDDETMIIVGKDD